LSELPLIQLGTARLQLLPQRAAYLVDSQCLLVADMHLGKAHNFRRLGVPVPGGTTAATLARLSQAVQQTQARQVVFLGDLLHAKGGANPQTWQTVQDWRRAHAELELVLVRGNHDQQAGDPPAAWQIRCETEPLLLGGLALRHHPQAVPGHYTLAGHLHPAVVLQGRRPGRIAVGRRSGPGPGRLRLPCFHFGTQLGVLPAFGEFTGMFVPPRLRGDRVFAIADDSVLEVPG